MTSDPFQKYFDFSGKHFFITGASSGIGQSAAVLLSELGATISFTGRDVDRLQETEALLSGKNHRYKPYDLGNFGGISAFMRSFSESAGPFDGMFHAAGVDGTFPVRLLNPDRIDRVLSASIKASLLLCKGFMQTFSKSGANSIVLMSSVSAISGTKGYSVYSASKAAIDGAVKSLALELAPEQVRINSIVAGAVETEMHQRMTSVLSNEGLRQLEDRFPLGFGHVSDISNIVAFLMSPASRWITGTSVVVDGGYSCR